MTTQYYIPAGRYGVPPDYPPAEEIKMAESYLEAADDHFAEGDYELAAREYRSAGICYSRAAVQQENDPLDHIGVQLLESRCHMADMVQECRTRIRNRHPQWVARFTA